MKNNNKNENNNNKMENNNNKMKIIRLAKIKKFKKLL